MPGKGMPETPLLWGHAALGDVLGAPRRPLLTVQGGEGVGTHALHSGPSWGPRCGAWNFGKVT